MSDASKLEELLDEVRKRPELYLDENTLTCLSALIYGFMHAGTPPSAFQADFANFKPWIFSRFGLSFPAPQSWAHVIRFFTRNDHEAFDRFWVLLDEFTRREH